MTKQDNCNSQRSEQRVAHRFLVVMVAVRAVHVTVIVVMIVVVVAVGAVDVGLLSHDAHSGM